MDMSLGRVRTLAEKLSTYTRGPKCNADGTYTIGNCEPDATCRQAAEVLNAQVDVIVSVRSDITRLTASLDASARDLVQARKAYEDLAQEHEALKSSLAAAPAAPEPAPDTRLAPLSKERINEIIVATARERGALPEMCRWVDYDPDTGPVDEHWEASDDILAAVRAVLAAQPAPAVAAAVGTLTAPHDARLALAAVAVHHAVEACIAATGQRRVINTYVNRIDLAREVVKAFDGAEKTGGAV